MTEPPAHPVTPDGRYLVVRGRLWRMANPELDPDDRARLQRELMAARSALGRARRAGDDEARRLARRRIDAAKVALGERGPPWWTDGAPDYNRRLVVNTPYRSWFERLLEGGDSPSERERRPTRPPSADAATIPDGPPPDHPEHRTIPMSRPRVLSVGQCGYDHASISRFLRESCDAEVDPADSADEAIEALRAGPGRYGLVLVNRVFDRGGSGLELIRALREDAALVGVPVMLVSNLADAQRQAVEAGALPGFGKSDLGDAAVAGRLRDALGLPGGS